MKTIDEIRDNLNTMDHTDCRDELLATLAIIGKLEADFEILVKEVAAIGGEGSWNQKFRNMRIARGIKI